MYTTVKRWAQYSLYLGAVVLTACDHDNGPTVETGSFVDAPVSNIAFRTATQSGRTNANGDFRFLAGEQVTFSFGNISLPPVTARTVVTPVDIAQETDSTANVNSGVVVNIARLLQSVDEDGNPDNGIGIPEGLNPNAAIDFTADTATFEAAFAAEFPATALVSESAATTHLQQQIDALDTGGNTGAGSGNQICAFGGDPTSVSTLPAALASQVVDLVVTTANTGSPVVLDQVVNFTFSSSGALFIDDTEIVNAAPYQCAASTAEFLWFDEPNDLIYAVAVIDGALHEVSLLDSAGTFFASLETQGSGGNTTAFSLSGSIANPDTVSGQWELFVDSGFNNDGSLATISNITFSAGDIADGAAYEVRPSSTDCSVTNGTGTVNGANITDIAIVCAAPVASASFSVSGVINNDGAVSGQWVATGTSASNDGSLASNTNETFLTGLANGDSYDVIAQGSPLSACTVTNGSGTVAGADVSNVVIDCVQDNTVRFNISGTTTGVSSGDGSVQLVNGSTGVPLEVLSSSAGANSFSFNGVPENSNYAVVFSNTDDFFCSRNASANGTLTANVTDALLTCTPQLYGVTGSITGADSVGGLTLELRATDGSVLSSASPLSAGFFGFNDAQPNGTAYTVAISATPATLNCTLSNASGTIAAATVTNIQVDCIADTVAGMAKVQDGNFVKVVFGDDRFVAAAADGLYMSLDGLLWTKASSGSAGSDLDWDEANNQFIVAPGAFPGTASGGTLFTSTDGLDWTSVSTNQCSAACLGAQHLAVSNGNYVLTTFGVANRQVVISSDLINWTSVDTGANSILADVVAFGAAGGFIALSNNGEVVTSSDNGATWSVTANLDTDADLAVNGNLIFSLGQGRTNGFKIDQSSDGTTWETKLMPVSIGASQTLHVGSLFAVGADSGLLAGDTIKSINLLEGVDSLTLNVPTFVKAIAENNGNLAVATATGMWFGKPVLAGPPKPTFSINGFIDGSGFVNGSNQTVTVQLLADGILAGEQTSANSYNFSNIEGTNYELRISATQNANVSCVASPSSGAVSDGDSVNAPINCAAKAPVGDGALAAGEQGISATILGATYSLIPDTNIAGSRLELNIPSNNANIVVATAAESWSMTVPNEAGVYTCGQSVPSDLGGTFTVSLNTFASTLSAYPSTPDSCTIEVLSINATSITARFSMAIESTQFPRAEDVIVVDGFLNIE